MSSEYPKPHDWAEQKGLIDPMWITAQLIVGNVCWFLYQGDEDDRRELYVAPVMDGQADFQAAWPASKIRTWGGTDWRDESVTIGKITTRRDHLVRLFREYQPLI